ncbi:MAG TPA: NADH-quinone oxidoreductase subunit J [Nitrospirota bacterium]|nr:NADH-quinone oxidoreductase subunit J [Nitrospirota bacterium]
MTSGLNNIVFLCVALLTTVPCLVVVFSRNILYSAFALFFTFLGTSGLYFFLDAEFLAITQVVVYIGGVSVLLLFAILLTKNVDAIRKTNMMSGGRMALVAAAAIVLLGSFGYALKSAVWVHSGSSAYPATTINGLGDLLMSKYLMPFEIISVLLLAVLIGSLVIARRSVK